MPHTKKPFLNVMRAFGYNVSDNGVCAGFINMYVYAELCGNTKKIESRFPLILDLAEEKFEYEGKRNPGEILAAVREKVKQHAHLHSFEKQILEIDAYFSGIVVAHEIDRYRALSTEFIPKADVVKLSTLIGPEKLRAMGGVERVYQQSLLLNEKKLTAFFQDLSSVIHTYDTVAKNKKQTDLSISLYSINHRIRIKYDVDRQSWLLTDNNQLPSKEFRSNDFAAAVIDALHDKDATAFEVEIFTPKSNPLIDDIKLMLDKFQHAHKISTSMIKEKTQPTDINAGSVRITHIAAMHNDVSTLEIIAKKEPGQLFKIDGDHYSPLCYAAQYGFVDAAKVIVKLDEKALFDRGELGLSPVQIAIENENINIIKILAEHKKLLLKHANTDQSPVLYAIRHGKQSSLDTLLQIEPQLANIADKSGNTPAHEAIYSSHAAMMIDTLGRHGAKFTLENQAGKSPFMLAVTNKKWDCAALMLLHTNNSSQLNKMLGEDNLKQGIITYLKKCGDFSHKQAFIQSLKASDNDLIKDFIANNDIEKLNTHTTSSKLKF